MEQAGDDQKVSEDVTVAGEEVLMSQNPKGAAPVARSDDEAEARFSRSVSEEREEEDLAGVLEELQLSLSITSVVEQEVEMLGPMTEAENAGGDGSTIRRRKRRRRSKKASE